jgi:hypothetical protein
MAKPLVRSVQPENTANHPKNYRNQSKLENTLTKVSIPHLKTVQMAQSARKMEQFRLATLARDVMNDMALTILLILSLSNARPERSAQDQLQVKSAIARLEVSHWLEPNSAPYVLLANTVQTLTTPVSIAQEATTRTSQVSRLVLSAQLVPRVLVYPKGPQHANMELIRQSKV